MEYYEHDLASCTRGFGEYADRCAPGVADLLAPVRGGPGLRAVTGVRS